MSSVTSTSADGLPSAWECVAPTTACARATKRQLIPRSRAYEQQAMDAGARVVLATFQDRRHLTPASRAAYARLARAGLQVSVFARGLVSDYQPASDGLRHVALLPGDPLVHEWDIVVLGPRPFAFVARDLNPGAAVLGKDLDRAFSWAETTDRVLVERAAHALLARVPVPV